MVVLCCFPRGWAGGDQAVVPGSCCCGAGSVGLAAVGAALPLLGGALVARFGWGAAQFAVGSLSLVAWWFLSSSPDVM